MSEWIRKDNLDVRSLLVVKDGKLIFERYGDGLGRDFNYELYSVTKTMTALTFSILADQGKIKPSDKAASWILKTHPEFAEAVNDKQDITLENLMSMSSGLLYKQVEGTDPLYFTAPNRLQVALTTTPRIPPATEFEYGRKSGSGRRCNSGSLRRTGTAIRRGTSFQAAGHEERALDRCR